MHCDVERRRPHPRRSTSIATRRLRPWPSLPTALPTRTAGTTTRSRSRFTRRADPTSGIAACSRVAYAGPDNPNARPSRGTAVTTAGNVTSSRRTPLKYDATPPDGHEFELTGSQRAAARLHWTRLGGREVLDPAPARARPEGRCAERRLQRRKAVEAASPIAGSSPAASISYQLTATDDAANQERRRRSTFVARGALLDPGSGERVTKPPLLVWAAERGASYYNVDARPGPPRVQRVAHAARGCKLPRAWTYHGRRYKLRPGSYRWFVVARIRLALCRAVREDARRQHLHVRRLGLGGGVRRHRLLLVLGVCALLLTPSAAGGPAVPGDPTPPVVTPHFFGTQGLNGWWVIERHAQLDGRGSGVADPRDPRLRRGHAHHRHRRHLVHVLREERRRRDDGHGHDQASTRPALWSPPRRPARPTRTAGTTTALSVSFSGTDATSGIDSCVPPQSYSGPDNANASVTGSCRDRAGNVTVRTFALELRRDGADR